MKIMYTRKRLLTTCAITLSDAVGDFHPGQLNQTTVPEHHHMSSPREQALLTTQHLTTSQRVGTKTAPSQNPAMLCQLPRLDPLPGHLQFSTSNLHAIVHPTAMATTVSEGSFCTPPYWFQGLSQGQILSPMATQQWSQISSASSMSPQPAVHALPQTEQLQQACVVANLDDHTQLDIGNQRTVACSGCGSLPSSTLLSPD